MLDEARITAQHAALCDAAGHAFYNTSKFTFRDLTSRGSQQQPVADFEDCLNGFSPNVQDILDNFKFRNQLQTLSKADAIDAAVEAVKERSGAAAADKTLLDSLITIRTTLGSQSMGTVEAALTLETEALELFRSREARIALRGSMAPDLSATTIRAPGFAGLLGVLGRVMLRWNTVQT